LVAVWRGTLLAKNVLEGKTMGYKNHPQLNRFKEAENPEETINEYLSEIYLEANNKNYNFDKSKINWDFKHTSIPVTSKQVEYEFLHLLKKLAQRDQDKYKLLLKVKSPDTAGIFNSICGGNWSMGTNQ